MFEAWFSFSFWPIKQFNMMTVAASEATEGFVWAELSEGQSKVFI